MKRSEVTIGATPYDPAPGERGCASTSPRAWRALLLLLALAGCRAHADEPEPEPGALAVHCGPMVARPMRAALTLRGTTQLAPERHAHVAAQVAGRVQRLSVREGDAVVAGQVIALVETAPLQDQAAAAADSLASARVAVTSAQATVARLEPLVAHGIAAQQELDDARARLAQARAAVAAGQGVARVAAHEVGRGTVRAPIAGVVLRVLRGVGDLVDGTPNTPIVEVGDPSALEFVANATAADLAALRAGQSARVVLGRDDAEARAATVDRVALAVDPLTGIGAVRLRFAEAAVMPNGMTGAARVTVGERAGVLAVPAAALRAREGDRAEVVVCLANHHASVKEVTLGVADEGFVEVREGLEAADRVVLDRAVGIEDEAPLQERP